MVVFVFGVVLQCGLVRTLGVIFGGGGSDSGYFVCYSRCWWCGRGGGVVVKVVVQLRPALPLSFVVMPLILLSFETKICVD